MVSGGAPPNLLGPDMLNFSLFVGGGGGGGGIVGRSSTNIKQTVIVTAVGRRTT